MRHWGYQRQGEYRTYNVFGKFHLYLSGQASRSGEPARGEKVQTGVYRGAARAASRQACDAT